jgi:chemotaxis protein histidine kinase CheA
VKLLGGRVKVNSRPGSGTQIEVQVPAQASIHQAEARN